MTIANARRFDRVEAERLIQQQAARLAELEAVLAQQTATLQRLEARVAELESQLDEAKRAGKRQATPFSTGAPKARPNQSGQKTGHRATHRPAPEHVDHVEEAPLPPSCPDCGGSVVEDTVKAQYQVDIPRPIPTVVTQFNVHVGHCQRCQRRVQGRHAEQTSDALGAASIQIGPNAIGLAAEMKHGLGVSYGKAAHVLSSTFELTIERSTIVRADARLAQKLEPTYDYLIFQLRDSQVVRVDETGWKIGGHNAWLWVFTNHEVTVYAIDPTRAHQVAERILGRDYRGVVGCDCFLAYDALDYTQSKCAGHLLRRCSELIASQSRRAAQFSQQVARLLRGAIALKARRTTMSEAPGGSSRTVGQSISGEASTTSGCARTTSSQRASSVSLSRGVICKSAPLIRAARVAVLTCMAWPIMLVAKTAATPTAMARAVRKVRSRRDARFRQARLYTERIGRMVLQSPPSLHHPYLRARLGLRLTVSNHFTSASASSLSTTPPSHLPS